MARENAHTRFLRDPDADARRAELEAYIGRNPAPFLKLYDRLRATPDKPGGAMFTSFVAMAFFLGPCWFFYRRMWAWAWGLVAAMLALTFVPLPPGATAGVAVVLAIMGRYAYLTGAFSRIEKLRAGAPQADLEVLRRAGGVSPVAGWVSSVVFLALSVLAVLAIIGLGQSGAGGAEVR